MIQRQDGFSLIEVLIFTSILSVFFVVATSVTVASLRNMKINEHKILASHYSEQLLEWLRDQKEVDWELFTAQTGNWCFNQNPIAVWGTHATCPVGNYLDSIFQRNVSLAAVGNPINQVDVRVVVSWNELGNSYQVPLSTVFTLWEE